jgi:short-subunit dehydrogenase
MADLPAAVLAAHGKVNLLVNNAGITYQKFFATHTVQDWEKVVGINWWGVLYGCHYFLPALRIAAQQDGAHIVNMSSMAAWAGLPSQSSYCATKAAVRSLSEAMWAELGKDHIGVTSVHPGAIRTDMILATLQDSDDTEVARRNYRLVQKVGVTPEYAASRIIAAVRKNRMRVRIGTDAVLLDILKRLFPTGAQSLLRRLV